MTDENTPRFPPPLFDLGGNAFVQEVERLLDKFQEYHKRSGGGWSQMTAWVGDGADRKEIETCQASVSDRDKQKRWVLRMWDHDYDIVFSKDV